jgi:hypothetical protein
MNASTKANDGQKNADEHPDVFEGLSVPDEGIQFVPPMWVHHLSGGLSLMTSSNKHALLMPSSVGMTFFCQSQRASATAILQGQSGLRHLGSNFFRAAGEMDDAITQHFEISARAQNGSCLATTQSEEWHGVANALHHSERGADALVASRIASQIRTCTARLERLSVAYRAALTDAKNRSETPTTHKFTLNKYASYIGIEYRAALNELYALRDAALVGAYRLRFKQTSPFSMRRMQALVVETSGGCAELILHAMFSDVGDRLLDQMALYRSVAQHCLGATSPIFGDAYQLCLSSGPFGDLMYVLFPLYDDIEKMRAIERGSSKGILERPSQEELERFGRLGNYRDALEFCFDCFVRLLQIIDLIRRESGIEPRQVVITDKEILDLVVTDETGKVTRAKRDDTGRLVEY